MPSLTSLGLPDVRGRLPLLAGLAIDSFGSGCAGPLLLLFFTRVAEVPLGRAGVVVSAGFGVAIVVPALVAPVIDRVGARNIVVASQLLQGLAFCGLLFARSVPWLFVCTLLMACGQRAFWSSIFSLLADVSTEADRDRWFGLGGMMQAAGFGLGALAAGGLLAVGGTRPFLFAMALNVVSFSIAGWLLSRVAVTHRVHPDATDDAPVRLRGDRAFLSLIAVNTVFALCTMLVGIGLPVYVAEALPAPAWIVGILLALVSVILATGQTLVVRLTGGRRRTRVLVLAGLLWAAWGLLMSSLLHVPAWLVVPGLVVATLAFAAADLLHAATNNALAAAVAPQRGRGHYLSYWQYSFTLAGVVVPAFFAGLFDIRPEYPWLAIAVLAVAAAVTMVALERILPASAVRRPPG